MEEYRPRNPMANQSLALNFEARNERPLNVGKNVRRRLHYDGHVETTPKNGDLNYVPMRKQTNFTDRDMGLKSNSLNQS